MAKGKINTLKIWDLQKILEAEEIKPVYFFAGEDSWEIDNACRITEKKIKPLVESDFDKEVVNAEKKQSLGQILDLALAFPFGSGKKLITVKNFERLGDKNLLGNYLKSPAEFSVLICLNYGKINDPSKEPYFGLVEKQCYFESPKLNSSNLVPWLSSYARNMGLELSADNARYFAEITGESKAELEMQLLKIAEYLEGGREITFESIKQMASASRNFSIFDLLDAMGKGNRNGALEIVYNLLENDYDIVRVNSMLSKYIITLARAMELNKKRMPEKEAAREAGVSPYYYKNCLKARFLLNEKRLWQAGAALLDADRTKKTSAVDEKTIAANMIAAIMK